MTFEVQDIFDRDLNTLCVECLENWFQNDIPWEKALILDRAASSERCEKHETEHLGE